MTGREALPYWERKERLMEDFDIQSEKSTFYLRGENDPPEAPQQRKDTMNKTSERLF